MRFELIRSQMNDFRWCLGVLKSNWRINYIPPNYKHSEDEGTNAGRKDIKFYFIPRSGASEKGHF